MAYMRSYGGFGRSRRSSGSYRPRRSSSSGCKVMLNTTAKSGEAKAVIVTGFLNTSRQRISFVGTDADKKYQNNEKICKLSLTVTIDGVKQLRWGTWNPDKQLVYIQDTNIVGDPRADAAWFRRSGRSRRRY